MAEKKTGKRPSVAGKKVAQGSRIETTTSSKTGTPRIVSKSNKPKLFGKAGKPTKVKASKDPGMRGKGSAFRESETGTEAYVSGGSLSGGLDYSGVEPNSLNNNPAAEKAASKTTNKSADRPASETSETAGEAASKTTSKPGVAHRKRKGISRRFIIVALAIVVLLAIGTGLLAWNQWFRYDDTADIQGTWVIDGTSDTITITDTDMVMTDEVSYSYSLDTFQKTITFSFKQYSGSGSYAFSPERTTLVITETDADSGENVSTKLVKQ